VEGCSEGEERKGTAGERKKGVGKGKEEKKNVEGQSEEGRE